jgi:hypothetical protein
MRRRCRPTTSLRSTRGFHDRTRTIRHGGAETSCDRAADRQRMFMLGDGEMLVRATRGLHTPPISFISLPTVVVPVPLSPIPHKASPRRAGDADEALRLAHTLEQAS